jgi:hypothetical protein
MIHDQDLILCGKLIELPDCHILRGKDSWLGILDSYTTDLRMRGYQTVHDTSTARSLIATKDDEVIRDAEDNLLDPYTYSAQSLIEVTGPCPIQIPEGLYSRQCWKVIGDAESCYPPHISFIGMPILFPTSPPISIPDCDMIYHLDLRQRARSDRGSPFLRLKHPSGRPAAPKAETEEYDA